MTTAAKKLLAHRISAGFPSPATDYLEDTLDLNEYLVRNKAATFMFSVKGDSMIEDGILDGIDHPVVAHADAEPVLHARELLDAAGPRIVGKRTDRRAHPTRARAR